MKLWKKICLKGIVFIMIFSVLVVCVQDVLRYKGEYAEWLELRFDSYRTQVENGMDIDVMYFGSSPVFAAISPMTIWEERGFTGLNFGSSLQNVMSLYYSFLEVLETTTPKVLLLDFRDLTQARRPDDDYYYYPYRKAIDVIETDSIRWQLQMDMVKATGSLEHIFPIMRFHDRWSELTASDFHAVEYKYNEYSKGCYLCEKVLSVSLVGEYDENVAPIEYNDFSLVYYKKIVALCKEKGIKLIGFTAPTANIDKHMALQNTISKFCKENDIPYLNYNRLDLQKEIALDFSTDFYDKEHINYKGAIKLSKSLAVRLDELFDLPDHRNEEEYASWNDNLELFRERYLKK